MVLVHGQNLVGWIVNWNEIILMIITNIHTNKGNNIRMINATAAMGITEGKSIFFFSSRAVVLYERREKVNSSYGNLLTWNTQRRRRGWFIVYYYPILWERKGRYSGVIIISIVPTGWYIIHRTQQTVYVHHQSLPYIPIYYYCFVIRTEHNHT